MILQKQNMVGQLTQQQYGISDINNMMFVNLVTATVDFPNHKKITRRSENLQLPFAGGSAGFSVPGQDFNFTVGADSLTGTENVLPLVVSVQDEDNIAFSFTLNAPQGITPEKAFFLQGEPNSRLTGTGITLAPRPGIYYSWPQLDVVASPALEITVEGVDYKINGGNAWVDHQLMMTSLKNRDDKVFPIPFADDPRPFNGWSWMFVNLDDGNAFTLAAFQEGDFNAEPVIPYGYYISPDHESGQWNSQYIVGQMRMENFQGFPAIVDDPSSPAVLFPTAWQLLLQNMSGDSITGAAVPWISDGTFNGQSLQVISEHPIDYLDISGNHANGVGISESVGFEDVESYTQRALDYLESN